MDFDDPFSEPVLTKVPTTGRFQPKAKPRPKKGPPTVVKATKKPSGTSVPQNPVLDQSAQLQSSDNFEKLDGPIRSPITVTESLVHALEDKNLSDEAREAAGSERTEDASSDTIRKDLGAYTSLESQLRTDIIGLSTISADRSAETPMLDSSRIQNEEELPVFANVSFATASIVRSCNSQIAPGESRDNTLQDSECFKESTVGGDGDFQIDVEQLRAGEFSCLDTKDMTSEIAAASEKKAVKYQPKPKAQRNRLNDSTDVLHMGLDGNFSFDSSVDQPDIVVPEDTETCLENEQQIAENLKERESHDALDSSAKSVSESVMSGFEGNGNENDVLEGMNDEVHDNSGLYDTVPDESVSNKDENNDVEHLVEETSQKKRLRKSKKVASENDKPARKRRKAAQEPGEATVKPPKKFPRRTRQKRCVDKSLLEAPEDELDLQRVPIRDLIILAEYKERQAKKQAAAALPPLSSESTENMIEDPLFDDNGAFGFDQDGDAFDKPSTSGVVTKDTGYFNYHTYMTKEPRARWMKHDTELFYKGISQFGSDLSMIQQLFPGRTRHQIKLKYKKEERQNPMRLNDALTNRAQDLSHFELVITRLQEQAAQEIKSDEEDPVCPTKKDEGPEEVLDTNNEDDTNSKQNKEGRVAEQEPDKQQVESPSKSYYSEDEDFDWSSYRSEL